MTPYDPEAAALVCTRTDCPVVVYGDGTLDSTGTNLLTLADALAEAVKRDHEGHVSKSFKQCPYGACPEARAYLTARKAGGA